MHDLIMFEESAKMLQLSSGAAVAAQTGRVQQGTNAEVTVTGRKELQTGKKF